VGSGGARVLVGTRAAESVAFAPASPVLAVAPMHGRASSVLNGDDECC
jgi:hypothetical protein